MNWASVKQQARDTVHGTFGVEAYYTPAATGVESPDPITARYHQKTGFIGDDYDGDFNPGILAQISRVILDTSEVPNPQRLDKLRFPDFGDLVLVIQATTPQGQNKVMCEVVED